MSAAEPEHDCVCGEDVPHGRWLLGRRTCLPCGEVVARRGMLARARCVVTMHKSNTVYVGMGPGAAQHVVDITRMRRG